MKYLRIFGLVIIASIAIICLLGAFLFAMFWPLALVFLSLGVLLTTSVFKLNKGAPWMRWAALYPALLLLLGGGGLWGVSFVEVGEYRTVQSPDNKFYATASPDALSAYGFGSPGGSGDKSGWIRIYSKEGLYFGRQRVPMVSMVDDLRWGEGEAFVVSEQNANWQLR